jgi:phosphonate transport system substrate-binding protein
MPLQILIIIASSITLAFTQNVFAQDKTGWPQELNFGVIPVENVEETTERFEPLAKHLEQTLGIPVNFTIGADFAAVVIAMEFKNLDVAYFSPSAYIQAAKQAGAEAFAREDTLKTGSGFHSIIVAKTGSGIETLKDAKDKSFAFVDPNSTSGYFAPLDYFNNELGVAPDAYFSNITFSGSHETSIEGVIEGMYDVAVTSDQEIDIAILDKEISSWDDIKILWQSELIPSSPLAYRSDLPESLKVALQEAVLSFNNEEALEEARLKGYVTTTDKDYDMVRELEALVEATQ